MELLEELKIKTDNEALYLEALTHTSYANENHMISYERLEFLGDAVLDLFITESLYAMMELDEGQMTKLRAHYVCESALYEYALSFKLNNYILLGKGEEAQGGKFRKAIVADVFEAFIGAMFLDKGFDFTKAFLQAKVNPIIVGDQINFINDYKSVLQELLQTEKRSLEYVVITEAGPAHNRLFTVDVKIDDIIYGTGTAHSKKEAEQLAAKEALSKSTGNENSIKKE